jgi:hypothetical protein
MGYLEKSRESRLEREICDLKRLLAEKVLEVDFFKGALQHIESPTARTADLAGRHSRVHPERSVAAR